MFAAAVLLLLSGQPAAPPVDPCAEAANCRVVRDFELRAPDGRRVPVRTGGRRTPWIVQDNLLLTPGDSLTVRFEDRGGGRAPVRVRTGVESARTAPAAGEVRFGFAQAADAALVLTAESRVGEALGYTAVLANLARPGPQTPPVCPLAANATTTERFNAPIVSLTLAGFRAAPAGATACGPGVAGVAASRPAAVADGRLTLPLGQFVVLRLDASSGGGLRPVVVSSEPAAARMRDAFTADLVAQGAAQQRQTGDEERLVPLNAPDGLRPPAPPQDQIRLTFGAGPDGRSLLLIAENGYARVLDYRATMRLADGRSARTTVCRVVRGLPVAESWSDPIVALDLEGFELLEPGPEPRDRIGVCD